jgi:ABC-type uncharacterized transport system ATPase subunit
VTPGGGPPAERPAEFLSDRSNLVGYYKHGKGISAELDPSSSGAVEGVPSIDIHELTRRFDSVVAVDRVTISIRQGEMFGLIGPNGAGKSTLISKRQLRGVLSTAH